MSLNSLGSHEEGYHTSTQIIKQKIIDELTAQNLDLTIYDMDTIVKDVKDFLKGFDIQNNNSNEYYLQVCNKVALYTDFLTATLQQQYPMREKEASFHHGYLQVAVRISNTIEIIGLGSIKKSSVDKLTIQEHNNKIKTLLLKSQILPIQYQQLFVEIYDKINTIAIQYL